MSAHLDGEGYRTGSGPAPEPYTPYLWPEEREATVPLEPTSGGNVDITPTDALVIEDGAGRAIFRFCPDGSVEVPDPDRMQEAAAIFFREVLHTAELLGYPVRKLPWEAET